MARYYHYDGLAPENLTHVACAVCDEDDTEPVGDDAGFRIVRCRQCGFVYVNPRPDAEQLAGFYEKFYDADAIVPDKWEREMGDLFVECADWMTARQPSGRVLDVGCSFGHLLMEMERRGWETEGVEPSPVAAEYAREHLKGRVHEAVFEDLSFEAERFDAVVSLYVLEHVTDPRGFVKTVHDVLKPGGLAIIRIPYTAPLFPLQRLLGRPLMYAPMHLNDFTPGSMLRLARNVGFRDAEVRVGARRHAHDLVENVGARVLGGVGRVVEIATRGKRLFPLVGALSYRLVK